MLRKEETEAENKLWQQIRAKKLGVKFRRQHPISDYVVDFFCSEKKLIIEVDGGIHLSPEVRAKDVDRQRMLSSLGYQVLRITNKEVEDDVFEVLGKIRQAISSMNDN